MLLLPETQDAPPETPNAGPATRVGIVTGAAQGIGRAIALRLAADGVWVAVNDIAPKSDLLTELVALIERKGGRALSLTADVSNEDNVRDMVNRVITELGRVDIMVANAGIAISGESIMDADIEKWEHLWSINVRGVVLCYKYAAIQMVKQGFGGRIIGASSICGKKGFAKMGAYCSSKFAVRALTQTAALELRQHGITVNSYAPGLIQTPMTLAPCDEQYGGPTGFVKNTLRIPDAETGSPEDIAGLVSYLTSPEASFMTGQTVTVDGGILFD